MSVESSSIQPGSAKARLRVLNPAEETVVTPDVVEIDTARETFTAVAHSLKGIAKCGIWLSPYRGVPQVSFMPELDIAYLNERFEVLRCVESYRQSAMELPQLNASSALVFPVGQLSSARIERGSCLEIRDVATGVLMSAAVPAAIRESSAPTDESKYEAEEPGLKSFLGGLLRGKSERRRGKRHVISGSVAYFSIGSPQAQEVQDISTDGFYVRTQDRWLKGTSLLVGLGIVHPTSREVEAMISVRSKVVRTGSDGVGFVYDDEPAHPDTMLGATDPEHLVQLQRFMQRIQRG
jgi:hypothetical protein